MSNYHLKDKELSLKAKGLLSYMLSLPDDWDYSLNGLIAICKESRDALKSTIKELKDHSYIRIEMSRKQNGKFEYIYSIYEEPFQIPAKNKNSPMTGFPATANPATENHTQINTKEQIDKYDKTNNLKTKHNSLTLELINMNYISEEDNSSFYFDELFKDYLSNGYSHIELLGAIHYIVPRVITRCFKDENGKFIENKYGYFKTSLESNFEKLRNRSIDLYSDSYNEEFLKDFDIEGR